MVLFCVQLVEISSKFEKDVDVQVVKQFFGGKESLHMTRSRVFLDKSSIEERKAIVFGSDESAGGVIVFDGKPVQRTQVIKSQSPVLDLELVESDEQKMSIAILTEESLSLWTKTA